MKLIRILIACSAGAGGLCAAVLPAHAATCSDVALGVALDAWGRTLLAGSAFDNRIIEWDGGHAHHGDLALARLLPDGSADSSFGVAGSVVIDVGEFDELSEVVSEGPRVYAAGVAAAMAEGQRGERDLIVVRLGPTGDRDGAFGVAGVARLDLGGDEQVHALAADPRGGVWLAGATTVQGESDGFVLRVDDAGRLVPGAGQQGVFRFDTGSPDDRLLSLRIFGHEVHAAGVTTVAGEAAAVAIALALDGVPLTGYGQAGSSVVPVGEALGEGAVALHGASGSLAVTLTHVSEEGDGTVHAVTTLFDRHGASEGPGPELDLPAGTSLAAGGIWWGGALYLSGAVYSDDFGVSDAFLARATEAQLDPSFNGGLVREHLALEYTSFQDVAVSFDGVTVAGWEFSEQPATLSASDALVARYLASGELDASFGTGGIVLHDFRGGADVCAAVEE